MSDFLKPKKIESVEPLQTHLNLVLEEVAPTQINITTGNQEYPDPEDIGIDLNKPKQINMLEEMANRLENCATISGIDDLKDKLTKLGIRFDTDPKLYQKPDFWLLICILYRALVHLYESNPEDIIVTDWLNPHSDKYIPSEKLVAETINELEGDISQETLDRILAITDEASLRLRGDLSLLEALNVEISNRQQADLNLLNSKQDKLTAGPGISIVNNVISNTNLSAEWGNIAGNLEDQEDLQEALDEKANIDDIPTNVSELNNDVGYLTTETDPTVPSWAKQPSKPTYTASEVGALPDDTFIPKKTSDLTNDSGFITSADIQVIDKTQDSSTTFVIDPNKMYMFGERTLLTITLNPGESGIVNEYMFLFTSGSVATTLNVPVSVTWSQTPNLQTNKKYLVDIENNLGLIGEWEDE